MAFIKEVAPVLEALVAARMPVLLVGAPGIGKTALARSVQDALDCDMILSHPVVADPTDARGLPWPAKSGDEATFLPFGDLARALKATRPTIWMLDDIGQASPAVQASFMQLLLARRINGHVLSDYVTFLAASNRREDRAGVRGLLTPVKSRFATIIEVEADLESWCAWALSHGVPPVLVAFLRFRPELLHDFDPARDGASMANFPCPRTWEYVGRMMTMGLTGPALFLAAQGAVGEKAAIELQAFLTLVAANLPSPDAVLANPDAAPVPERPDILWALVTALVKVAKPETAGGLLRYAEVLNEHRKAEFGARMVLDLERANPAILQTPEWTRFATSATGQEFLVR